ncbi:MAG TPA: hypothetical protein VFY22_07995 [Hydrogenophaga sp.]|nr:hypothetical protein [Hydrogenophaga sp.]
MAGTDFGELEDLGGALAAPLLVTLAETLAADLGATLAATFGATLAGAFLADGLDAGALLAFAKEDADDFETFVWAGEASLAPALPVDAAADGRPLAPDALGWAVLAVLVAGAFTTGLLSDPDDARSSGWWEAETEVLRATPLAGRAGVDVVIPALEWRLLDGATRPGWSAILGRDCNEAASCKGNALPAGKPNRWRSETNSTVSPGSFGECQQPA